MGTLNDIRDAGFTHIAIPCETCRMLVCKPIKSFSEIQRRRPFDLVVKHLACEQCGSRPAPDKVRPWRASDAPGHP